MTVKIKAATPSAKDEKTAAMEPARAIPQVRPLKAKIPPTMASMSISSLGMTNKLMANGSQRGRSICGINREKKPKKDIPITKKTIPAILRQPATISKIPAVLGIQLLFIHPPEKFSVITLYSY